MKIKQGMVFGVFDGLHEGHRYFLHEAATRCAELTVVVARDETVQRLKNKTPKHSLDKRIAAIEAFDPVLTVVAGDETEGEWKRLTDVKPDGIFLGYDQHAIAASLDELGLAYEFLPAHRPHVFKSGLIDT